MSKAFETPALRRERQDAMYQRALGSMPGDQLQFPGLG